MSQKIGDAKGITFAPKDRIDAYEGTGRIFMREIFDMNWDSILVTDESDLSDFSMCGPDGWMDDAGVYLESDFKVEYGRWKTWVLARVKIRFGVELSTDDKRLVDIFAEIEFNVSSSTRH